MSVLFLLHRTLKIISVLFLLKILSSANSDAQAGRRIYLQSKTAGLEIIYGAEDTVENCSIVANTVQHKTASLMNESYLATLPTSVIPVSETFMASVTESCESLQHHLKGAVEPRRKRFIIYPGTKWCGVGNRAISNFELGRHTFTDACCRMHDTCPVSINPFKTLMGLTNFGLFPSSDCNCDAEFYYCLKLSPEPAAAEIGDIYFNFLRPDCIDFAPSLICIARSKLTRNCVYVQPQLDLPRVPTFIRNPFVF